MLSSAPFPDFTYSGKRQAGKVYLGPENQLGHISEIKLGGGGFAGMSEQTFLTGHVTRDKVRGHIFTSVV